MSAEGQIKSFIDRVLRLKEEQDEIGRDIREIYAEAKSMGFDKTQMGKVVAHLRKAEKIGADGMSEAEAIFDAYLSAYHRASGTAIATHTHEAVPHDPETGEILESGSNAPAASSSRLTDAVPDESAVAYQESVGVQPAAFTSSAAHEADKSAAPILESVQSHEAAVVSEPAESSSDEISATNQPETARDEPEGEADASGDFERDTAQSVPAHLIDGNIVADGLSRSTNSEPDASGVEPSPSEPVRKSSLRPLCRYPGEDRCGGYGSVTCHACLTAAQAEVAA